MTAKISIIKCQDYSPDLVFAAIKEAIDLIGGITNFIKPQSKVLVKPNLLLAKEPEYGITTHPQVVAAVVRILKGINCQVLVGDGPSVWGNQIENVDEVYERTGIKRICQEEGAQLVRFEKRRMREKFPLTTCLDECDYLLNIPKFKTHDFMILTAAIKNLFGLVSGTFKTELHKKYFEPEGFARMLVDIYQEVKPNLTVIDGIVAMEGDGPASSGKLRNAGLILAGADCVALDSVLALIMGLSPKDILTTKIAAERNLGISDPDSIQILGEKLEDVLPEHFELPSTSLKRKIPRPVIEIAKKFIRFYPKVKHNNCNLCHACIDACPNQAITNKSHKIIIDYAKCISCFCCQEACPESAIKVKKSALAKLIGL